jgi:hypothetical protein
MFAKVIHQDKEIKKIFYERIKEKVEKEKQNLKDKIDEEYPKILSWLVKSVAVASYNAKQTHDTSKGSSGEDELRRQMWALLPRDSIILPDFVFESRKDDFIQIDQIIINLKGIFLIEVKTWSGSFLASNREWKRKEGNKWVTCSNPTKQHKRHFELFNLWFERNLPELYPVVKDYIHPVIVLKRVDWIQSKYSSIPVVSGASGLVDFIIEKERGKLSSEMVETVVEKLRTAKPYEEPKVKYDEGTTRYGKKYVRVYGTREDAEKVAQDYKVNHKISEIREDKNDKNVHFFYCE